MSFIEPSKQLMEMRGLWPGRVKAGCGLPNAGTWLVHYSFEVVFNFHKWRGPHKISHFCLFWKIKNTDKTGPTWQVTKAEKWLPILEELPVPQSSSISTALYCCTRALVPSFTSPCCILLGSWVRDFQAILETPWWPRLYLSQHRV